MLKRKTPRRENRFPGGKLFLEALIFKMQVFTFGGKKIFKSLAKKKKKRSL